MTKRKGGRGQTREDVRRESGIKRNGGIKRGGERAKWRANPVRLPQHAKHNILLLIFRYFNFVVMSNRLAGKERLEKSIEADAERTLLRVNEPCVIYHVT